MSINDEAEITVFSGKAQKIEVLMQQEVQLDINVPLFYIKSGEEEIQAYVNNHAKPQIDLYTSEKKAEIGTATAENVAQAKDDIKTFVKDEINPSIQRYADTEVKPALDVLKDEAAAAAQAAQSSEQNAASAAELATVQAGASSVSASAAAASAEEAKNQVMPDQTGNNGKFLTTDGTAPFWGQVLPDQAGNTGKFLATNGGVASWENVTMVQVEYLD